MKVIKDISFEEKFNFLKIYITFTKSYTSFLKEWKLKKLENL